MKRPSTARLSQWIFLLVFAVLFVKTEYRGSDTISAAINSFFRADPLVLASYLAANRTFTWLLFPALLMLGFTLLLGRFFCGWICPLGTVLDLVTARIKKTAPLQVLKGNLKYYLLLPLLFAALFHVNLAGILDPLAILVRALTFFLYPLFGDTLRGGWVGLYRLIGERRDLLEPGFNLLRNHLLPFRETFYPLAFLSALLFFGILFLERYETRNWCRNLCPLGTLLGIFSRFSPFKRLPGRLCGDCSNCRSVCPTSFDSDELLQEECVLCLECLTGCEKGRARFAWKPGGPRSAGFVPQRRVLLGGLASGFLLSGLFRFRRPEAEARVLRPPGVQSEDDFLKKCVRCGECLKVCLTGALYPAIAQAGVEGIYTPVVTPRLGYCEFNCTLCGQVCPTAAIPSLPVAEKRRAVIGKAHLDKNHCLPFARRTNCIVCEEHCPIPQKAIRSEIVETLDLEGKPISLQQPYVVEELCNGCGICENVCPLEGKSGIEVLAVKDRTPLKRAAIAPPEARSTHKKESGTGTSEDAAGVTEGGGGVGGGGKEDAHPRKESQGAVKAGGAAQDAADPYGSDAYR
ncbi:(4Fe-4S)-binding protein [Geomonas silvestris]|uniref:(4Fe-4S)-binding protein n=1 Tax=Geomonas silvestris TaxID=2740184 RepID=A0A6V8MD20_9BACT|nr:4Fe-4S binding protein [Geomonas silvestris]GFO57836.1 (4Fe-4S)-binding protein [Geomonas silvestris]